MKELLLHRVEVLRRSKSQGARRTIQALWSIMLGNMRVHLAHMGVEIDTVRAYSK